MSPKRKSKGKATRISTRINSPVYKLSDTVLCNFNGQLYDATILDVKRADALEEMKKEDDSSDDPVSIRTMSNDAECYDKFAYYLHYKKWNSGWDEWVRSDCLTPITEDSRKQQRDLKLAARKEKLKKTSKKKKRRYRRQTTLSQSPSGSQEAIPDVDNLSEKINLMGETASTEQLEDEKEGSDMADNLETDPEPMDDDEDIEDRPVLTSENQELNENSSSSPPEPLENNREKDKAVDFMINEQEKSNPITPDIISDVVVNVNGLETDTEVLEKIVGAENRTDSTRENQESKPVPLSLVQYANSPSPTGPLEIDKCFRFDENEEFNTSSPKMIMEHPCSVVGNPTINEVLPELQNYLSSIKTIGGLLGPAFIRKLQCMLEIFCKKVIISACRETAEQRMIANGVSLFGSVLHYSGLFKFIAVLESEDWVRLECYDSPFVVSYDLEDMRSMFRICKEYFDATKS